MLYTKLDNVRWSGSMWARSFLSNGGLLQVDYYYLLSVKNDDSLLIDHSEVQALLSLHSPNRNFSTLV